MLTAHLKWRQDQKIDELAAQSDEDILGSSRTFVLDMCPHWVSGYDLQGQPFVFHQYASLDVGTLLGEAPMDHLVKYHIWAQENLSRLVAAKSRECGFVVETWVTVSPSLVSSSRRSLSSPFALAFFEFHRARTCPSAVGPMSPP